MYIYYKYDLFAFISLKTSAFFIAIVPEYIYINDMALQHYFLH